MILKVPSANDGVHNVLIDSEDYELISKYKWHVHKWRYVFYVQAWTNINGKGKTLLMHKLILGAKRKEIVDHIDGNGLNNQKTNLRICTNTQNCWNQRIAKNNTTGFKGVTFVKATKRYRARIRVNSKLILVGDFKTAQEAGEAYNWAALNHYGDFARLNPILCAEYQAR